jgi:tetratricopeptide (TPR) repeat protein
MRRPLLLLALLSFFLVAPAAPLASAAQVTPEALTAAYKQAMQARDWAGAMLAARQLVALSPAAESLRLLADAQLYSGASAQQEKPAQDQPDADWKDNLAKIYTGKGNALLKLHRTEEAIEAYNHAAEFAANPGLAYFNVCAVLYNTGNTHDSAAACRKSLQADPSRANAWFILGSDLFADATPNASGKVAISVEARQALNKYLELAPDGPHAADVKAMLQMAEK